MNHFTRKSFWDCYALLPAEVRDLVDKNFALLKETPRHPTLHFKQIGQLWSVWVGEDYRALGLDDAVGVVWFWIGPHTEYAHLLKRW